MAYSYNQEIERQRVPYLLTPPPSPEWNPQPMPDFNVRLRVTLTGWHDWEPFGLSVTPAVDPAFGIEVNYSPDANGDQTLVLETGAFSSPLHSTELREALELVYAVARTEATKRLNAMPYQLPLY